MRYIAEPKNNNDISENIGSRENTLRYIAVINNILLKTQLGNITCYCRGNSMNRSSVGSGMEMKAAGV